jgi:hypothetical protein
VASCVAELVGERSQQQFPDEAPDFIRRHRNEPFFLYEPHAYIHGPRFARKELSDKAEGDVTRAQIEGVDWGVGEILKTLKEQGLAEKLKNLFDEYAARPEAYQESHRPQFRESYLWMLGCRENWN